MKLSIKLNKKNALLVSLALVLTFITIYLMLVGHSQFKSMYHSISIRHYSLSARRAYYNEYHKLESVLMPLGVINNQDIVPECKTMGLGQYSSSPRKLLLCSAQAENNVEINSSNREDIISSAQKLDNLVGELGIIENKANQQSFEEYLSAIVNDTNLNNFTPNTVSYQNQNYQCTILIANTTYPDTEPRNYPNSYSYYISFGCSSPILKV